MKNKILKFGVITTLLICVSIPFTAFAGDFTIYPSRTHEGNKSWIISDAAQGETLSEEIILENLTDKTLTLSLALREASEQKENFIVSENLDYKNIGNWIILPHNSYTLAPKQKVSVPIEITVPEDAVMGSYKAAIFGVEENTNADNMKIVTRIGVRIYLDVTGTNIGLASIFSNSESQGIAFLLLSAAGLIGSIFYNLILHLEHQKYAKKK